MSILYKVSEWQSAIGEVHIQCEDLVGTGRNWSEPAKVLGISVVDLVKK